MKLVGCFVGACVVAVLAGASSAQSLNIRFGSAATTPSSNYAAAGLPGVWNSFVLTAGWATQPLVGLDGAPLAAQYYQFGNASVLSFDNPLTSGDDGKLMDNMLLSTNSPTDGCFWVQGLALGQYELTIYALTPNDSTLLNRVRVDNGTPGPVTIGGVWPGHHQDGVSYARFTVTTSDGVIAFHDGLAGANIQSGMNGVQFRYLGACSTPSVYCTAKTNSLGCVPSIGSSGTPSFGTGSGFAIGAANVLNGKGGLLFYGVNGAAALPFQGGVLCVKPPIRRTALQSSGGNPPPSDCSGHYSFDFNAYIASGVDPALVAGAKVDAQYWTRDPSSPSTTGLTDAIDFAICF